MSLVGNQMLDNKYAFCWSTSKDPDFVNLQLHLWELACVYFRDLPDDAVPRIFLPQAAVVLTLAGTSVSQLLGQTHEDFQTDNRVPQPDKMLETIINRLLDMDSPRKDDYPRVLQSFKEFVKERYDPIRHFGLPKHVQLDRFTIGSVTRDMYLLWDVWQVVADYWYTQWGSPFSLIQMRRPCRNVPLS